MVFIVAEIGINHNGDMNLAKNMILAAKESGADAVKFQNYKTEDFVLDRTVEYTYLSKGEKVTEKQFDMFKRYELNFDQLKELKSYCDDIDITFFSTPTGKQGINELIQLGVSVIKNGSDFLQNLPFIEELAKTRIPIIISTGMANLEEIKSTIKVAKKNGAKNITLLYCVSNYP